VPLGIPLVTVACISVVGRFNPLGGRRQVAIGPEPHPVDGVLPVASRFVWRAFVVAVPRPAQRVNARQRPQVRRGLRGVQGIQQGKTIFPDRLGIGLAFSLLPGQMRILNPFGVALVPLRGDDVLQPCRGDGGQIVECRPQRLSDEFQPAARTCVASVRCCPPALSRPKARQRSSSMSNKRASARPASSHPEIHSAQKNRGLGR
jgi:hypothetical protein